MNLQELAERERFAKSNRSVNPFRELFPDDASPLTVVTALTSALRRAERACRSGRYNRAYDLLSQVEYVLDDALGILDQTALRHGQRTYNYFNDEARFIQDQDEA